MANRKLPTSLSTPPVGGIPYVDAVASKVGMLFNSIALKPTAIVNAGNDYTITVDPVLDADVVANMSFFISPSANNTGPCRLRVTSTNPWYDLVKASGEALAAGDFATGTAYHVVFMGGEFRILSVANSEADAGAGTYYQEFLVSGTWTKPVGLSPDAIIEVEIWAGGGGGGSSNTHSSGGGGGAYNTRRFRASDLTSSVSATVGAGGALNVAGGNSSFGSYLTAYGGGPGTHGAGGAGQSASGGGGGGASSAGGGGVSIGAGGNGGGPSNTSGVLAADGDTLAGSTVGTVSKGNYGGGGGGINGTAGSVSRGGGATWGGGGGSGRGAAAGSGGSSLYGGGGGCSNIGGTGGISTFGGNGGNSGVAGSVPGGGGGAGAVGGAGKIIVRVVG